MKSFQRNELHNYRRRSRRQFASGSAPNNGFAHRPSVSRTLSSGQTQFSRDLLSAFANPVEFLPEFVALWIGGEGR